MFTEVRVCQLQDETTPACSMLSIIQPCESAVPRVMCAAYRIGTLSLPILAALATTSWKVANFCG
jgi:hypothetical protein